jgi:hypothetical protein
VLHVHRLVHRFQLHHHRHLSRQAAITPTV